MAYGGWSLWVYTRKYSWISLLPRTAQTSNLSLARHSFFGFFWDFEFAICGASSSDLLRRLPGRRALSVLWAGLHIVLYLSPGGIWEDSENQIRNWAVTTFWVFVGIRKVVLRKCRPLSPGRRLAGFSRWHQLLQLHPSFVLRWRPNKVPCPCRQTLPCHDVGTRLARGSSCASHDPPAQPGCQIQGWQSAKP